MPSIAGICVSPAESLVRELLAHLLSVSPESLRLGQRLATDLRLDGDDYGMWLVPEVQKRLSIRPSLSEWESVFTVGDLIAVVERHVAQRTAGM
jgi:acyl carrier protein